MMAQLDPRSKLFAVFLFIFLVIATPGDANGRFLLYFLLAAGLTAAAGAPLTFVLRRMLLLIPLLGFLILSLYLFSPLSPAEKWLQKWKVPSLITSLLTFAQRYMVLFLQEIETTRRAWTSRRFGRITKRDSIKMTARLAPHILFNALGRSETIYAAMLSRGFNGRLPSRSALRLEFKDYAFLLGFGLAAVLIQVVIP